MIIVHSTVLELVCNCILIIQIVKLDLPISGYLLLVAKCILLSSGWANSQGHGFAGRARELACSGGPVDL